ncbi:MAG: malic enzyme [Bacteroidetes bacterium GWF2_42_66]|nr:MAG: malic enzyme [Bacteroidetes bacterium GWE2_42_39]OFY41461.1 MAG: malic enzyme [Bacteroidetes bacterium GWF2_42_66]HBL75508.1 NADP-dependent malic enzyme [Prolixibacteraceae bacterium]HCR91839.1 NADP-dependent malic enzyme [Prolixibacteraceae bacterium]HCU60583.1 NADP-dependent malic enzyme [Prolixibacteraceae bacterium]
MNTKQKSDALNYHSEGRPGKIQVIPTKPHSTQRDLSLAYSPGVAEPCLEIEKDPQYAYDYTAKGNLVAVISNGTAVLGLGDIGALAGKPVMEGKGLLFKIFADIDVFDIEVNEKDPAKFIEVVKAISPTFGGINLEDIKAPECFEIEEKLKEQLDIPLMHDDQHGTAIISGAALLNALELVGKKIEDVKIVVNGAGAAASSCAQLYMHLGAKLENIVMVDSKGVISTRRTDLNSRKRPFATSREISTLEEAVRGSDVFLGLSVAGVLSKEMVRSMAENPIVFALANPNPEISYNDAMTSRPDIIFATGRSDHPNQVNNVLGFPYIFRGALDVRSTSINEEMKVAATLAIAHLAKEPVPEVVTSAYNTSHISFGREYIIPKPLDPRLLVTVAPAVAKAAIESGVARKTISDWDAYADQLRLRMGLDNKLIHGLTEKAKENPKRVVFAEANHINMLKAAQVARTEGICIPVLLGNEERIAKIIAENNIDLEGVEIVNMRHDREESRRQKYAKMLAQKRQREGMTYNEAYEKMFDRNYFGMGMVEAGDADACITGVYTKYTDAIKPAIEIIGIREGLKHIAGLNIVNNKLGTFFFADTLVNNHPNADTLVDVALLTNHTVQLFNIQPVVAMLSYSNFGERNIGSPATVHDAVARIHAEHPEVLLDGEMQVNFALDKNLRREKFPFSKIDGMDVNTLIFPNLNSANISYKMMLEIGMSETIGPIQMGLNKPVHILNIESSIRDIVNMVTIAVIDAGFEEQKLKNKA